MGFSATPDKTEREQANWWARAVSTFLADPTSSISASMRSKIYLYLGKTPSATRKISYLGITRADRAKKLAFYTVDMLTDLLDVGTITTAPGEVTVTVSEVEAKELYHHLFKRPDGSQVLFHL
jgi:hypothetical protein